MWIHISKLPKIWLLGIFLLTVTKNSGLQDGFLNYRYVHSIILTHNTLFPGCYMYSNGRQDAQRDKRWYQTQRKQLLVLTWLVSKGKFHVACLRVAKCMVTFREKKKYTTHNDEKLKTQLSYDTKKCCKNKKTLQLHFYTEVLYTKSLSYKPSTLHIKQCSNQETVLKVFHIQYMHIQHLPWGKHQLALTVKVVPATACSKICRLV